MHKFVSWGDEYFNRGTNPKNRYGFVPSAKQHAAILHKQEMVSRSGSR
jgi:hypothetical protein